MHQDFFFLQVFDGGEALHLERGTRRRRISIKIWRLRLTVHQNALITIRQVRDLRCTQERIPFIARGLFGSRYGAHEDVEFIRKLSHIIRTIVNEHPAKKLVGICFGHQLIAHSLGGLSGPSADEVGWELGLKPLRFERGALQAVFPSLGPSFLEQACSETKPLQILQVHRDQVKRLPPQATLVASSTKTAFEVYALGKQVLCFQGHPEFSPEVVSYLLQTKEALQLLPQNATIPLYSPDNEVFVKLIRNFTQPARSRL